MDRSLSEKIFLLFFFPIVIAFYLIYKYPLWFTAEELVVPTFYWLGKSTSFWYSSLYTLVVCSIALKTFTSGKTPYGKNKKKGISNYQKWKFISIFASQLFFFYLIPYILPYLLKGGEFFNDQYAPVNKNAYVYFYNGFTSLGGAIYIFVVVPLSVWFFGKRYCSWFCACGNLAETIGVTKWGNRWVTGRTPRGTGPQKLEIIQYIFLLFATIFGVILLLDLWQIISAPSLIVGTRAIQDLVVDLIFGALIGVGAYPLLGTRIWCRYGCPLAAGMRLFGKLTKGHFKVVANDKCKGLNLCTAQCPMGIDVASFAHKDKKPIMGSFSLENSPCIGCGGCIDICPVQGISFQKILKGDPANK
ncbi:MAG: 4Fe-4S binding protein [Bdellovibrionales bacterium]|nr:4Fe-4S binding protein [Bdellovibrionales bacterium]MBT3525863.1 4Fe-4S binding protein [Bdellovibrionales bacterium]MBT7670112.1 4Fe-4S binding protein [Bdellovibrionales bacterium]MBT7766599.1 4Fe-4S binding protein [Bdellovibrionales bacterium]